MSKKQKAVWAHSTLILVLVATFALTTCDVFKAGLGPKIDIKAPSVSFSDGLNGRYLNGTVPLTGDVSDDVAVKSVALDVYEGGTDSAHLKDTLSASVANNTWKLNLATTKYSQEEQATLTLHVTDTSNKTTDQSAVVYFDNVAPTLTGMTPSAANLGSPDYALSEKTTISGSVKDGLGVSKTVLTVGDVALTADSTMHPAAWSLVLDTTQFYNAGGNPLHGASKYGSSGLYSVPYTVQAWDLAGNASSTITGTLYINPDGAPNVDVPDVTAGIDPGITYPRSSFASSIPTSVGSSIIAPGATFKFRVSDLDGIDDSQLYVSIVLGSAVTGGHTAAPTALVPQSAVAVYKVGDATYPLKESVLDQTSLAAGGTVPTRAEYSFTLPTTQGEYMLLIHAADLASNKISAASAERYLPSAPSGGVYAYSSLFVTNQTTNVTIDTPTEGGYSSGTLAASGSATSDDKLKNVVLKITDLGTSTVISTETVPIPGSPTAYTWTYSKGGLSDGHYSLVAQASSQLGITSSAITRNFVVDTTRPTVGITPLTGSQSGTIGISGSSNDTGSGVVKVEYSLDSATGPWTAAGGTSPWSGSLDLSSASEGSHTLYARATDLAGNVTALVDYASLAFDVDRANPKATETNYGATLVQSAAQLAFAGAAIDDIVTAGRQASSISLSYTKDGVAQPSLSLSGSGATGNLTWNKTSGAWSWILPAPADHSGDGLYAITLTVTDVAGKTASVTRSAQIDTTAPTLVVSTPQPGESTTQTTYTISGTSRDTGGVGFSGTNDVEYKLNGGSWTSAALSGTNWSVPIALGPSEGSQNLQVRSTDKAGNQTPVNTITFFYDLYPPSMSETTLAGASNPASYSCATNAAIHFGGAVSDTDALAASGYLQVSIDGAAAVDVSGLTSAPYTAVITGSGNSRTWTLSAAVGTGGIADGSHTFAFTAKDIAGKTTTLTRTVTVDTTKPSSGITTPAALAPSDSSYWLSGSTATFLGASSDPGSGATGVASVYYTIAAKSAAMPAFSTSTWSLAGGTTNWNATVPLSAEGEFTLYIAAIDAVGNVETPISRSFGVDQNPPAVDESHAASFSTKALFTLSGNIGDTNALSALSVTETKSGGGSKTVVIASPATVSGTSQAWASESLPVGISSTDIDNHLADGTYTYSILVRDVAGKITAITRTVHIDTTPPTVGLTAPPAWVSGSAYTIGGTAADGGSSPSGVANVSYRFDGQAAAAATWTDGSGNNTSGTWSATLTGLLEGQHTLSVSASDAAGNAATTPATGSFGVDFNPPTLTANTPDSILTSGSGAQDADFSGTIGDTNDMASSAAFTVSYTKNGGAATSLTLGADVYSYVLHTTNNTWTWKPFGAGGIDLAGHTNDGIYVFTFTATDIAGKTTVLTRNVTIDTKAPQITVTAPTNTTPMTWVSTAAIKATGVADDGTGSGVKYVYALVDSASNDHSSDSKAAVLAGWTLASGTVSWSANLSVGSTEEAKTLWIKAADNDGNWTTASEAIAAKVGFGYDKTKPSLASSDSVPSVTNASFSLTGNVADSGSGIATFTVSADGGTAVSQTYSAGAWTYPVTVPADHSYDGAHTYVFTAADLAGNAISITRSITVDTKSPSVTFYNVDTTKNTAATAVTIVDSLPKITGALTDDTGVGTAQTLVEHSSDNGVTWTVVEAATALSTSGSNPKSLTFSKDMSTSAFTADGLYRITITAADTISPSPNSNSGSPAVAWFRLDRSDPSVTAIVSSTLSSYANSDFSLTGTAASPNLSSVQYKIDSGATVVLASGITAGSYAIAINNVPGSTLSEGSHTATVQAISTGGRVGTQTYSFTVDRTAPVLSISQPSASSMIVSGATAAVSGSVSETGSGLKTVSYQFAKGLSASSNGSTTISTSVDPGVSVGDSVFFAAYTGGSLPSPLDKDTTYYVISKGASSLTVSASKAGPAITVGAGSGYYLAKAGSWAVSTYSANSWSNLAVDTTAMTEGSYIFLAQAVDNAGNASVIRAQRVIVDQAVPTLSITGKPSTTILKAGFTLSGTAADAADASVPASTNGIVSVSFALNDSNFSADHTAAVTSGLSAGTAWSFDLAAASAPTQFFSGVLGTATSFATIPDGSYTVYVRATDKAGRTTDGSFAFTKDATPPDVSYSNIAPAGTTVLQDSSPAVKGTVSDVSGVASATYTLKGYDYSTTSWFTIASGQSLGASGKVVNWAVDLSSSGLNLPDGLYEVSVTAADTAGNSATSTDTQFKLARMSPSASISYPAMGTFQKGAFPVTGKVFDANGISSLKAKVASSNPDFASGTSATAALAASLNTATSTFSTASAHGLLVGDPVYIVGLASDGTLATTSVTVNSTNATLSPSTAYFVNTVASSTTFTLRDGSGNAVATNSTNASNYLVGSSKFGFTPKPQAVAVTANSDTITGTSLSLSKGQVVYFLGSGLPGGIAAATPYYVVGTPTSTAFQVSTSANGTAFAPSSTGSNVSIASPVDWIIPSLSVSGSSEGSLTAYVQVSAGSSLSTIASRDFILDTSAPTIAISSPSSGSRSVGNLTLMGTSSDSGSLPSGVTGTIQYQIGRLYNLSGSWTSANVTGGSYSWTISLGDMSTYASSLYATLCDSSGTPVTAAAATISGSTFTVASQTYSDGAIVYLSGSPLPSFGGTMISPNAAYYVTNITGNSFQLSSTWPSKTIQTVTDAGSSVAVSTQPPLWKLPIVFQAVDKAGNVSQKTDYYLILDPNGNIPVVSVSQPATGLTFGGQQRITGTAVQPVWVHDIEVNVDPTNTGTFPEANWVPATLVTTGNNVIWYYDINVGNTYPQSGTSQTVQVQVRAWNSSTAGGSRGSISGKLTSPLVMTFNNSFPQVQSIKVNGLDYYSQMITKGTVNLTGTVSSSKGITKLEVVESSPLSGSTPIYDTSANYGATSGANGAYWASTVTPPASKTSDTFSSGNKIKVMIVAPGSQSSAWTAIGASSATAGTVFTPLAGTLDVSSSGGSFIESDGSGSFNYSVSLNLNSTQMFSGTSGEYSVNLRMTDMTSPTSQVANMPVILDIDNYYPMSSQINPVVVSAGSFLAGTRYAIVSVGTTDFTAIGSPSNGLGQTFVATGTGAGTGTAIPVMTGSSYKIQGAATDVGTGYGSIASLKKVVVYLTDPTGTSLMYMKGTGSTSSATYLTSLAAARNMADSGKIESVPYPVTSSGYNQYFASIDTTSETGVNDYNGDGFIESFITDGNSMDWWVQLDTTALADGPALVHYVVWDSAGNATHYSQWVFVSNSAPTLTGIDIGTDLNGDGTVSAGEIKSFTSGYSATNFSVRNDLLYIKPNYSGGLNTPMYFSIKYGGVERNGTLTNGSVTISDFTSIPDSSGTNDRTFTIYVYDSTAGTTPGTNSQGFVQAVSLTIKNKDLAPPAIDLAPFGKRWSAPTDSSNGGINTDAGKTLGNVSAYTDNVAGAIGALLGHVEYATDSNYNPISVTLATPSSGSFTNTGSNGLSAGSVVYFSWKPANAPSSTPNGQGPYYVIGSPTATSFQVSATKGGAAASFGSSGSGISLATPDLSGQVIFRGKFADDQRIASLSATIPGYNGGSPVVLASWSSTANSGAGGLVANTGTDWVFALDPGTESASMADGHVANWSFQFDTSKIATVAAANVPVTFTVTDGGGNTSAASINVDVVPYITDFSRKTPFDARLSANSVMNHGADGYYPVYQGATGHVIKGFNLSTNAQVGNLTKVSLLNPVLTGTTSLTVDIPTTLLPGSLGDESNLTVTTNGIASINNGTNYASSASVNGNGALFRSYLTEEGVFTNARRIYVDDLAPSISVAPFGQSYPAQDTDDNVGTGDTLKALSTPPAEDPTDTSITKTVLDNYTKNVPYVGNDDTVKINWQGHVEWAADGVVNSGRPALSGQVTFKGKAFDNQRISRITATIQGFDGGSGTSSEFEIYNSTNGFEYYTGTAFASTGTGYTGSGTKSVLLGTKGWTAWADGSDYQVVDSTRVYKGHVLNWNFTMDTSKVTGVAATAVMVTFTAYDGNAVKHSGSSSIAVDIVPYITRVDTKLSSFSTTAPSVYNRTALGKYPVAEGDSVLLNGFNLTGSSTAVAIKGSPDTAVSTTTTAAVPANMMIPGYPYTITTLGSTNFTKYGASANTVGTAFIAKSAGTGSGTATPDASHAVSISVGTGTPSGDLYATVGSSIASINNVAARKTANTAGRTWNHLPNYIDNDLLFDDVSLEVWRYTQVAKSASGGINDPRMKIGPYNATSSLSNRIGFSFGQSVVFFSMPGLRTNTAQSSASSTPSNDGTRWSHTPFLMDYGWFTENDFAFDPQGNTYGVVLCPDTSATSGDTGNFSLLSRQNNNLVSSMQLDDNYSASGNFNTRLANTTMTTNGSTTTDIFRIQSPCVAATLPTPGSPADSASNKTNLYIAYYDEITGEIRYRYGTVGATPDVLSKSIEDLGYFYSSTSAKVFSSSYNTHLYQREGNNIPADIFANSYQSVASTATGSTFATNTTYQSGQYVALAVVPNSVSGTGDDVVVMAWYDGANRQLVYSYNDSPRYAVDVASTALVSGKRYYIFTPGTGVNWTSAGASASTVGTYFTATKATTTGSGGVAMQITDSSAQWQSHAVVIDSTTNAGLNVKMTVDSSGGVHIAYYVGTGGDLKYAYLPTYSSTSPCLATVDSYLSVGTDCCIDVAKVGTKQVPYISYFMPGNSGTIASAKVAYRVDMTDDSNMDGAVSDKYTQKWEVSIVPTNRTPQDSQVSVGVAKDASGNLIKFPTGTNSSNGDTSAQSYSVSPGQVIYGNGTNNPVLSFAVKENGILEMWQKK